MSVGQEFPNTTAIRSPKARYAQLTQAQQTDLIDILHHYIALDQKDRFKYDIHTGIYRANLVLEEKQALLVNNKKLRKIVYLETGQFSPFGNSKYLDQVKIILKYTDSQQDSYTLNAIPSRQHQDNIGVRNKLKGFLDKHATLSQSAFYSVEIRQLLDWRRTSISEQYKTIHNQPTTEIDKFYFLAHHAVAKKIVECATDPSCQHQGVTLFSFGCADGQDIETVYRALKKHAI